LSLIKPEWCLGLLCLVGVLCVSTSWSQAQESPQNKCLEYFTQIVEIQDLRQMLRHGVEEIIERYERGKLDKKILDSSVAIWHTTESELRERVTKIYDIAYSEKCFDNRSSEEEKK